MLQTGNLEGTFGIVMDFTGRSKVDHRPDTKRLHRDDIVLGQSKEDIATKQAATPNESSIGSRQPTQVPKVCHAFQSENARFMDHHAAITSPSR